MTEPLQPLESDNRDDRIVNVATHFKEMVRRHPYKRAVVCPFGRDRAGRVAYRHLTFQQLDEESDRLAHGLASAGIGRGTRTILMVRPSLEFFALTFAMFKTGAVPVVVDPGMGIRRMVACFRQSRPQAFIGIPLAHVVRTLFPKFFDTVQTWITVGRRWFWGGRTLNQIRQDPWQPHTMARTRAADTAAILFTTGSTGPAKGVVYTHGNFDAQVRTIQDHFDIGADEIDLPTFPLFALFDPALGMTAVIPDMDPTKPAQVNPERIIEAIVNQGVTNMFASPALLNRVGGYGKARGVRLPTLKRVVSAGAPVAPANIEQFSAMLSDEAQIHTPYGATEAVPIISIGSREILSETRPLSEKGYGMCVGRPIGEARVVLIRISDDPLPIWNADLEVADGEIGEIIVQGEIVTRAYYENDRADALAKIEEGAAIWHRMGDLGWRDKKGRIWFCGRKSHRVVTENGPFFTIPCEAIFNNHPAVFRSALVGVGPAENQTPVICIEVRAGEKTPRSQIKTELLAMARKSVLTRSIGTILFHKGFPVDIRHNSKIFREQLAVWAARKLGE
ncbi:MAG: AMP-binding protein [Desulfobacterales bacterium]|nr:AMP-binding protein [Desulfobacterales bacterium]